MALATRCQAPGVIFHTTITPNQVTVACDLPAPVDLAEADAELLEANLHNLVEIALAPWLADAPVRAGSRSQPGTASDQAEGLPADARKGSAAPPGAGASAWSRLPP